MLNILLSIFIFLGIAVFICGLYCGKTFTKEHMSLCFGHYKHMYIQEDLTKKGILELQNALTESNHVLIKENTKSSHAIFSRWIHCNAWNLANLNLCLLTFRQSPNWVITGKGRKQCNGDHMGLLALKGIAVLLEAWQSNTTRADLVLANTLKIK